MRIITVCVQTDDIENEKPVNVNMRRYAYTVYTDFTKFQQILQIGASNKRHKEPGMGINAPADARHGGKGAGNECMRNKDAINSQEQLRKDFCYA